MAGLNSVGGVGIFFIKKQNGGLFLVLRFYSPIFQHWGGVSVEKSHHGIIFTPLAGGESGGLFELSGKMHGVFIAAGECDIFNSSVGIGEVVLRGFDTAVDNVGITGHAESFFIQQVEIGFADTYQLSHFFYAPFL